MALQRTAPSCAPTSHVNGQERPCSLGHGPRVNLRPGPSGAARHHPTTNDNDHSAANRATALADEDPSNPWTLYLVRCGGCNRGVLVEHNFETTPNPFRTDKGDLSYVPRTLWPRTSSLSHLVPCDLRRAYQEASTCFAAGAFTAAAVMVRRTLEGVCADQGANGKVLMKSLQELLEAGMIEGRLFDWAQALRILGNQGAHFTGEHVDREDAADALALCEALLDYIYVLTTRYEEFMQRRQPSP
ncbi:DUF4145 domain-containing protein [Streptomyces niveus]|uniref:DUF4145 domain-containing protein n=1 Tax=Streptomyces niveus TaxID=193462 RepID=UPI003424B6D3